MTRKKISKKVLKKALELDMLGWWIIGIVALVILVLAVMILGGKGNRAIDFIKDLFKFKTTGT
jgi:hypothetical protein